MGWNQVLLYLSRAYTLLSGVLALTRVLRQVFETRRSKKPCGPDGMPETGPDSGPDLPPTPSTITPTGWDDLPPGPSI